MTIGQLTEAFFTDQLLQGVDLDKLIADNPQIMRAIAAAGLSMGLLTQTESEIADDIKSGRV